MEQGVLPLLVGLGGTRKGKIGRIDASPGGSHARRSGREGIGVSLGQAGEEGLEEGTGEGCWQNVDLVA